MKHKLVFLALSVSVLLVPVTALFAGGAQEADARVTLTYYEHDDRFNIAPTINQMYMEANPNVSVEFIQNPEGGADRVHDRLVTMLAARDGSVDIMLLDVIWPPEFIAAGWLEPLTDSFTPEMQAEYVPAMIDALTYEGDIYGIPTLNDVGHMFYRTDLLEEAGKEAPLYWPDLVDTSLGIMAENPGMIGFVNTYFPDQQLMCNYLEYLWGKGGEFLDPTGTEIRFESQESIDAIQFMKDMKDEWQILQPGVMTMGLDDGRQIFTQGQAVFHRNWNYVWAMSETHEESQIRGRVGVTKLPTFEGEDHYTALGGWSYTVNPFSQNVEAAVDLAMWMGSPEIQKFRAIESDRTPTHLPTLRDAEVQEVHPVYAEWQAYADTARARPKSPFYTQISDIFQRDLQRALGGDVSIEAAMAAAASEIRPIIQR